MKKDGVSVIIRSQTWTRDSNGLYDYESSKVTKNTIKSTSPAYIVRKEQYVYQIPQKIEISEDFKYLIQLQVIEGNYAVRPALVGERTLLNNSCEKNWFVVRALNSTKGYMITEGDVIKMGRLKFRVKELKGADPAKRIKDFCLSDLISANNLTEEDEEDNDGIKFKLPCRICLTEKYTEDNPLICPCNCDGTMKYIHLKCLQRALRSKVTTRTSESSLSFSWKAMSCDICKKSYPYRFMLNGQSIELIQIPKPPEKYVILEGLCKDKNSSKWLHVISLNSKDSIKLGRGNDCELRMSDISVSRLHAQIKLIGSNFFLEDKGSKFGTLVQIKRPLALENGVEISIQAGRTLLIFSIKKPWSIIPTCFRSNTSPYEIFFAPYQPGAIPLLPINTGIPLSIDDAEELMYRAGLTNGKKISHEHNENLMFEHGQLGMNSSIEESGVDGVEAIQEVHAPDMEENNIVEESPEVVADPPRNRSFV
ncbi:hypothetical protein SteCoe_17895 [Stentor coeruleus]|uniref:FHA domain-containing protein n=1 Tax=Stentor coeruleus TaxID=5963 RepID=A0A1R2B3K2_9CILI|nr:hypothetical protein SteCoe_30481 [Stentor coeruleus]OMJ81587.1 hypothetical protein SteCoe_17895 [Stentor coeruleus]